MLGPLRYVIWVAVLASLTVYGYRAYKRWVAPDDDDLDPAPTPSSDDPAPPPSARRGLGFRDPRSVVDDPAPEGSESLVQAVIREELARKQGRDPDADAPAGPGVTAADPSGAGSTAGSARGGLFAGAGGEPADRVSVAAALTGARLPDDVVPLVGDALDPHHVTFLSESTPAAEIGGHLGDELERIGYAVRSEGDRVAVATKGEVTLRITLHPDAGTERVDGAARWPTAGPTSVVIEIASV